MVEAWGQAEHSRPSFGKSEDQNRALSLSQAQCSSGGECMNVSCREDRGAGCVQG